MTTQNYKKHHKFYTPHHFVFYPVLLIVLGLSIYYSIQDSLQSALWIFISILVVSILWLSFMLRQHYALLLQDRLIRTEMRFRYYLLTQQRLEQIEHLLSDKQLFALRFASDAELPALVKKTIDQKLSSRAIKRTIVNWLPDHHRV